MVFFFLETHSVTISVYLIVCPSSCGNIQNISNPFQLMSDPEACSDLRYELSCENNRTVLKLFEGKYNVQEINYNKYTILVVDSGIQENNYFSTPSYSLYRYNFSFQQPALPYYSSNSSISHSKRYKYITTGTISAKDVRDSCKVEQMVLTSCRGNDNQNISCTEVHNKLVYGFELSWIGILCETHCGRGRVLLSYLTARMVLGTSWVVALLIHKWRRRHLSTDDAIEEFLESQNNFMPIRYSYSEIRKMTGGFKDKLGEGAIKMLDKSKANGQDFISEGPKRALIYEFMPNGSLDKYIFSLEGRNPLSIEKIYEISLGVARGIEYLHRGCDMQILHFDIKPHNILLDENFTPKVSDFGLAKLYPANDSIMSLTAARGTLGYIAPELFYKNIGGISYKADVYSFGMLLLEMASRRKNFSALVDHSISKGNDIIMEDSTKEEKKVFNKMIIVALWCIQMKPSDRCSMNKVAEMLVGEVEGLQMPSKPFLSSLGDVGHNLNPTCSSIQSSESA
ncbi:hypothetical protein ACB092_12G047300 [Castanea dentata]